MDKLEAHPSASIAHGLDALKFVGAGFGNTALPTSPNVAGPRFDEPRVIGDKNGYRSTIRLAEDLKLVHRLPDTAATDIRFVYAIRNLYDNIATMHKLALKHSQDLLWRRLSRTIFPDAR